MKKQTPPGAGRFTSGGFVGTHPKSGGSSASFGGIWTWVFIGVILTVFMALLWQVPEVRELALGLRGWLLGWFGW